MFIKFVFLALLCVYVSCITRSDVIQRAKCWADVKLPYNKEAYAYDCDRSTKYRTDCSGMVSMAWKTGKNYTTRDIQQVSRKISMSDLKAGDALLAPNHHVILFDKWIDNKTFWAYEEMPKGAGHYKWKNSSLKGKYHAIRYNNIQE